MGTLQRACRLPRAYLEQKQKGLEERRSLRQPHPRCQSEDLISIPVRKTKLRHKPSQPAHPKQSAPSTGTGCRIKASSSPLELTVSPLELHPIQRNLCRRLIFDISF